MKINALMTLLVILSGMMISCKNDSSTPSNEGAQISPVENASEYPEMTDPPIGQTLFIGTYTRTEGHVDGKGAGVYKAVLEPNGKVTVTGAYPTGPNPSYIAIHPSKKFLYAVNEVGGTAEEQFGLLEAYSIENDLTLTKLNDSSTEGVAPCYVSLDKMGTRVYTANYVTGEMLTYGVLVDGKLSNPTAKIKFSGVGPTDRQTEPHAHFVAEGPNGLIFTADLGTDSIRIFDISTSRPILSQSIPTNPGAGPRHVAFNPNQDLFYVINELNGTIESFIKKGKQYSRLETISTTGKKEGLKAGCADIHITPNGKFLYATNRGDYNTIAMYTVQSNGKLSYNGEVGSEGKVPRNFAIDPTGKFLLCANQNSDNIVTYHINQNNGILQNPVVSTGIKTPVCIKFL